MLWDVFQVQSQKISVKGEVWRLLQIQILAFFILHQIVVNLWVLF